MTEQTHEQSSHLDIITQNVKEAVKAQGGRIKTPVDEASVRLVATCVQAFYETHDSDGTDDAMFLELTMTCLRNLFPITYPRLHLWDRIAAATDRFGNVDPVDGFEAIDEFIWDSRD